MENANGLGRLLSQQLLAAGETVVDVPARLSARVRALSGAGHKTDAHDALSTAVAGRHGTGVKTVAVDDPLLVLLDVVVERRWQLVAARQKTLCRIHDRLTCLLPGGADRHLTTDKAAGLLRRVRPADPVGIRRRLIVRELVAELRHWTARSPRWTPTSRGCSTSTASPCAASSGSAASAPPRSWRSPATPPDSGR